MTINNFYIGKDKFEMYIGDMTFYKRFKIATLILLGRKVIIPGIGVDKEMFETEREGGEV